MHPRLTLTLLKLHLQRGRPTHTGSIQTFRAIVLFHLTMTAPTVKSTDDINDFLSYLETPSPRCLSANNSVVASPTTMSPTTMSPTTMSPNNATDITEEEVRALFDLWNSALATGDSRIVASCYTKVSYVLSLSLSHAMHLTHKQILSVLNQLFVAVAGPPPYYL